MIIKIDKRENKKFNLRIKDFLCDLFFCLFSAKTEENVELIKKLSEKFNFVESEILLQKITDSELKKNLMFDEKEISNYNVNENLNKIENKEIIENEKEKIDNEFETLEF